MPPPKKPKTGSSRVEAYLTSNEIATLKRDLLTKLPLMWTKQEASAAPTSGTDEAEDLSMWKARSPDGCLSRLEKAMQAAPRLTPDDHQPNRQTLLATLLRASPSICCDNGAQLWPFDSEPAISKLSALMVEPRLSRGGGSEGAVSLVTRQSPGGATGQWDGRHGTAHQHWPCPASPATDSKSRLHWMLSSRQGQTDRHSPENNRPQSLLKPSLEKVLGTPQKAITLQLATSAFNRRAENACNLCSADEMKFSQQPLVIPPDLTSLGCSRQGSPLDQLDRLSDSSYELPSSTMDEPSKAVPEIPLKDGRQCQICSDTASGFHYGVWSCEGCKAFFKRSLQGPVDYVCPATNNCKIDKFRRKSCQACRLGKCLEMGMSKGNCRKEKGSRTQKGKRRLERDMDAVDIKKDKIKMMNEDAFQHSAAISALRPSVRVLGDRPVAPLTDHYPSMHPLVEHLLQIDPPVRMSGHDNSQADSERHLVLSIVKLANRELVDIINWAKVFPGYANFELKDRVRLLELCWTEVIVCGLIWRSMNFAQNRVLVLSPDLHLDRERCHISRLWPACDTLLALSSSFQRLAINCEEFVLIRALVLLNAEVSLQGCDDKWHSLRRSVTDVLDYTACARHDLPNDPSSSRDRLTQILLLLPHVRATASELFAWLRRAKDEHDVPFCDLLREMLDVRAAAMSPRSAFDR